MEFTSQSKIIDITKDNSHESYDNNDDSNIISVAVSDLGILTGYSTFDSPLSVIDKLFYQGKYDLYLHDVQELKKRGYVFVDEIEEIEKKLPLEVSKKVREVVSKQLKEKGVVHASKTADSLQQVKRLLKSVEKDKLIAAEDIKKFQDHKCKT